MKIELPQSVLDACARYNAMPEQDIGSLAALNLVSFIGERVANIVAVQIAKRGDLLAQREKLLADHHAGRVDTTMAGMELGRINAELLAIDKAKALP